MKLSPTRVTIAKPKSDEKKELEPQVKRDLTCLGDIARSIGFEILYISLQRRTSSGQLVTAQTKYPKGQSEREKKLSAILCTAGDGLANQGYAISKVDVKPVSTAKEGERKVWQMRVDVYLDVGNRS